MPQNQDSEAASFFPACIFANRLRCCGESHPDPFLDGFRTGYIASARRPLQPDASPAGRKAARRRCDKGIPGRRNVPSSTDCRKSNGKHRRDHRSRNSRLQYQGNPQIPYNPNPNPESQGLNRKARWVLRDLPVRLSPNSFFHFCSTLPASIRRRAAPVQRMQPESSSHVKRECRSR